MVFTLQGLAKFLDKGVKLLGKGLYVTFYYLQLAR